MQPSAASPTPCACFHPLFTCCPKPARALAVALCTCCCTEQRGQFNSLRVIAVVSSEPWHPVMWQHALYQTPQISRPSVQEMQDQQVTSLKAAVAQAMTEKEDTFEHLGEAREKNAELQDALRDANSQLRMLQVCLPVPLSNHMPAEL